MAQILDCYPYRDKQGERPRFFCLRCGQEQYSYDPPGVGGICRRCRRQERKREENAMTLQEMSTTYRAQAQRLRERDGRRRAKRNGSGSTAGPWP